MDFTDILKLANTNAAINNAQYGSTGQGFTDMLRPVADFLGGAHAAYSQGSRSGNAVAGLSSVMSGMSRRNYLSQLQKQQEAAQKFAMDQYLNEQNRMHNTVSGLNNLTQGQPFNFDPNSDIDTVRQVAQPYLEQFGKATNFANAGQYGKGAIAGGQDVSMAGAPIAQPPTPQAPMTQQSMPAGNMPIGGLDLGQYNTTLSAGIGEAAQPVGLNPMQNPYYLPTDIPAQVAGLHQAGLTDAQKQAGLNEEIRNHTMSNEVDKSKVNIQQQIVNATKANQGGYGRNAPAGRGLNQQELLLQLYGQDGLKNAGFGLSPFDAASDKVNFLQDQQESVLGQMKILGLVNNKGEPFGDLSPAQQKQFNELSTQYSGYSQAIQQASPARVNNAAPVVKQAGDNAVRSFSQWKQGK